MRLSVERFVFVREAAWLAIFPGGVDVDNSIFSRLLSLVLNQWLSLSGFESD